MTTDVVIDALNALKYIGMEYPDLNKKAPIDEFSVFVGNDHIEVEMHWYYADKTTIELADQLVTIANNLPAGSGSREMANIVENEGSDDRIDVTVIYPYKPAQ